MLKVLVSQIRKGFRYLAHIIPFHLINRTLNIIALIFTMVFSITMIGRYLSFVEGIRYYQNADYTAAIASFQKSQSFFVIDNWKIDFNTGTAQYGANSPAEARESFMDARDKAEAMNDPQIMCMIDTDIAFTYESSYDVQNRKINSRTYLDTENKQKASDLRQAAKYLIDAYTIRETVSHECGFLGGDDMKENRRYMDSDKTKYGDLLKQAFDLDGQYDSYIDSDKTAQTEFDKKNEVAKTEESINTTDTKVDQLMEQNQQAEADYQSQKQSQEGSGKSPVKKPW